MQTDKRHLCAYCGKGLGPKPTKEHVFPQGLYALSRRSSYEPLIVFVCSACNNSWSDDEALFRNVVTLAGEANQAASDLFKGKITRSFGKCDGQHRIEQLLDIMRPVQVDGVQRQMIYPGEDERVLRIIRKIVIGLAHYYGIATALAPARICVHVLRYEIPPELLEMMETKHQEADIVEYGYALLPEQGIHSVWTFTFFERTSFIALVSMSEDGSFPQANEP